jgi:arsenate reductase
MKVIFLCTANSCRSQMAEAWARQLFPAGWEARSAGLVTCPISAETRRAMAEAGVSMEGQRSQPLEDYDLDEFDLVVTLSRSAARFLPRLAAPERHLERYVPDPTAMTGRLSEMEAAYREARDRIRRIVEDIVAGRADPGACQDPVSRP